MKLDELAGESQTKPGALDLLVSGSDLAEFLENRSLIPGGNTYSGVGDRDLRHAVCDVRSNLDPTSLGRELDGVGQQVEHHLLHLALVGSGRPDFGDDLLGEPDASSASPLSD